MAEQVAKIVEVESLLRFDKLVVRLRNAWGLRRAGARIEAAVSQAGAFATARKLIQRSGQFVMHPKRPPILRDRQLVQSRSCCINQV